MSNSADYKQGVIFFNSGTKCALRLLVALYSLRKHYSGDISVMMDPLENPHNLIMLLDLFGAKPYFIDNLKLKCKRNNSYSTKPHILKNSPYEITFFSDADVLFQSNPSVLFSLAEKFGLLLTPFDILRITGRVMQSRMKSISDIISVQQIKEVTQKGISINTGVLAYSKNGSKDFFEEWNRTTILGKCRHIIDEITCQCIYYKYPHLMLDNSWNCSAKFSNIDKANIIHFHGRCHVSTHRKSAQIWVKTLKSMIEEKFSAAKEEIEQWICKDPQVNVFSNGHGLSGFYRALEQIQWI